MFTTSSPHSQVTKNSSEFQLQVSLVPLTHEMSPVELTTGTYQIGSSAECAVRIDVPGIAPEHCIINVGATEVSIRAIDPRVWVNDRPVRKVSLTAGTKFFVGPIGILVDAVTQIAVEEKKEQTPPEISPVSRNEIEIPAELQSMAKFQRILEERQVLLEKVEAEQVELQQEIHSQEAELAKLHKQFSLNQETNQIQEVKNTQVPFDDAILELDQKLQQLDLLKAEISQDQEQNLSQQNELRAAHQRLVQREASLIHEQAALKEQQQNLAHAWLDLEAQQACERVALETENAFLDVSKAEQEKRQQALSLTEQSNLSYERELSEERNRLESWVEDLETQEETLCDQQAALVEQKQALVEQKQALESKQASIADQDEVQQNLIQQTEQLRQEQDQLEEARRKLTEQQNQLQTQSEQLEQQQQSAQEVREDFEQKTAALEERDSQISQQRDEIAKQRPALDQRQADLNSQEADLKTQLQNLETQQKEYALLMNQLEEQQVHFEQEKLEWENARTSLEQDQIALESQASEIAEQKAQQQGQEDELQQQRVKLKTDREQFAAQQADLEQDRTELDSKQQQIQEREQSLNEREEELKSLQEEINERQLKIETDQDAQNAQTNESQQAEDTLKADREQFAKQQADLEQNRTELELKQQQLSEHENSLGERETQLASKEQELDALITEQQSLSEQEEELDRLRAELEQKQEELKTHEDQLSAREQEISQPVSSEEDQQTALEELTSEKQKLSMDHDQLTIDREEINSQRDNLESQRIQIQKDRGEIEDRERILEIREQQLSEREELIEEIGLNPIDDEAHAAEKDHQPSLASDHEEPNALQDSSEEAPQNPGSLLQSFLTDSTNETPDAQEESQAPEAKSGSLLDLFKKNSETETTDTENITEQNSLAEESVENREPSDEKEASDTEEASNAEDNDEDSDSIAEYMKKLLERSRGGKSENTNSQESASPQPSASPSKPIQHDTSLVPGSPEEPPAVPANLSMEEKLEAFNKAPTHTQDKDAVRDAINSFRDVANYSARMAIARHSKKHQRTDFMFKGVLTGVCVLTTIIIFAESIWGVNRLGVMKWAALAVSIASIAQFLRACHDSNKLFRVKQSPESNATEENEDSAPAVQSISTEESLEKPLAAANGIHKQQELLSVEEEELQLLEEQLKNSARAHDGRTASLSEEGDQSELSEIGQDVDQ